MTGTSTLRSISSSRAGTSASSRRKSPPFREGKTLIAPLCVPAQQDVGGGHGIRFAIDDSLQLLLEVLRALLELFLKEVPRHVEYPRPAELALAHRKLACRPEVRPVLADGRLEAVHVLAGNGAHREDGRGPCRPGPARSELEHAFQRRDCRSGFGFVGLTDHMDVCDLQNAGLDRLDVIAEPRR